MVIHYTPPEIHPNQEYNGNGRFDIGPTYRDSFIHTDDSIFSRKPVTPDVIMALEILIDKTDELCKRGLL
ncbi:hypothetical protein J4467_03805 [Candidatus Woesearchaeota archaeon]|nr:hypothetical protein [Candidatus Woesearchaeota archaeon]